MTYDIIVRFPNKELADKFRDQMADRGEPFNIGNTPCEFSEYTYMHDIQIHGQPMPFKLTESGKQVFFVYET